MNPPLLTLKDLSLKDYDLTPRVKDLREIYFRAVPEICIERPRLITQYSLKNDLFARKRISILDKARLYRYVLENRASIVRHHHAHERGMALFEFNDCSLFAGSTTSKFKGVLLYPEFLALTLWPELWTISTRATNPYYITNKDVEELNNNIFPHWMEKNIMELTRKRCYENNLREHGPKYAPEMKLLERIVFFLASKPSGISHTIPDFSRAIRFGLRQLIDEANDKKRGTSDESKKEFYEAILEVLEGIIAYSKRLSAKAREMATKEGDASRKEELLAIAEIHDQVPEFPARTFREGLTTLWICWTAILLENANIGLSLGRFDQVEVLYNLYQDGMEAKRLTIEQALELICCLWLKIGDHVPSVPETAEQLFGGAGSNQAITIGGIDKNGEDAVNDLTYVMLKATELLKLRDPNLNARYYPGKNSKDYLKRLCEVNISTGATPAIHNDRAVIKALISKGETNEQARDYGIIGCIEPGSNGRSYGHPGAILLNLTSVLELTLYNGRHRHTGDELISKETGDPLTFRSFNDFRKAFKEQARWLVDQATSLNNLFGKTYQDFYPTPILSAFFEGPMDKGKDLIQGGAIINSSGAAIIGLADVADSMSAIEKFIYDEKSISFPKLLGVLQEDFKGYEALHKRLMNPDKTPKYGNDNLKAEANVIWIIKMLDELFTEKTNYRGGGYRVGYWSMTNHAGFGILTKALPSGRKGGENFASGITPVSGVTPCLLKTLNSVAKLPVECLSNGIALNIKFTPEHRDEMLKNFVASVEGYFDSSDGKREGGMEIQFNVTSHQHFAYAFDNPDNYPDLLVRVSGYTAYFKDLSLQMKKEIIDRTEYLLSTREAADFPPFRLPEKT
jgi:formate C-acetyltransferase